jgi:sec-independent protein translocase protein TatA
MGAMSIWHWLIVLVIVLVLFGSNRLGDVGKGLGEGIRNFKKGIAGGDDEKATADPSDKPNAEPPKEPKQLPAKSSTDDEAAPEASAKREDEA